MKKLNIVFVGSDTIGTKLLQSLSENFNLSLVITGKDKAIGRKLKIQENPIKNTAKILGLKIFQPDNINSNDSLKKIKDYHPDMVIVMAYGQILSEEFIKLAKIDCLNVHTSLLPKYRGASPIQSAILNGEKKTGLSLMKVIKKMDAGPIYKQFEVVISEKENSTSLSEKLSQLSSEKIPKILIEIQNGLMAKSQNEKKVSYCKKIHKSDGEINWFESAKKILAKINAFNPWPGTYTFFNGKRLKILSAKIVNIKTPQNASLFQKEGIICGENAILPTFLQIEGKKPQSFLDFINGHPNFIESKLGK